LDYRFLEVNGAMERLSGRPRSALVGKLRSETHPADPEMMKVFARVVETGQPQRVERYSIAHDRWVSFVAFPQGGDRFATAVVDISERRRTERHQRYLIELSDALLALADVDSIKQTAARLLGEELRVERAFYAELEGGAYVVSRGYEHGSARDLPPYQASFDTSTLSELRAARSVVTQTRVDIPVVRDAALVAIFNVQHEEPRDWSDAEIALITETARRTWIACDRARLHVPRHGS
jgi:hypothetical protein